jgi:Ca2+-transporting ATPase
MKTADHVIDPYQQTTAELLCAFATDQENGLTQAEARIRLEKFGKNRLADEPSVPAWKMFLAQFTDVLVLLLIAAAVSSAILWTVERDSVLPYEAIAIIAIVLFNGLMGHAQQARAEHALASLRQMTASQAAVIRDGLHQSIPAEDLVCGDIILLEEGDAVPADARLIQAPALHIAEAALTGESLPVEKDTLAIVGEVVIGDRRNMVFSGTAVTSGRGRAVVTTTGVHTQIGRIAGLMSATADEATPLQKELDRVGRILAIVVVTIAVIMIGTIVLIEDVRGVSGLFDVFILGVALAVAAVPEGLPAVVTAVLSLGVQRMAKRNAVVRHLSAVETLGSADVIASDKTGTLTRNEMTVRQLVTASGSANFSGTGYTSGGGEIDGPFRAEFLRILAAATRATNAVLHETEGHWSVLGDPTEAALIVAAQKAGFDVETRVSRFTRVAEVPFSSQRKLMSTLETDDAHPDRLRVFIKGAPDVLIERCMFELIGAEARALTIDRRAEIRARNDALANDALRTIAVAFRTIPRDGFDFGSADETIEQDLVFLGLIGMIDPPRDEARDAVTLAKDAGIRLLMITGDHPRTASVIARELGIVDDDLVVTGVELSGMSEEELKTTVVRVSVYARVDPEHKLRIVQALQSQGLTVAMTGDGVNDAPALRTADIGIAMGIAGTDVSREAADIVLMDDNFASIVAAVEEGRGIFGNIRKFLRYLLSSNIGEVLTMFFGVLLADLIGLTGQGGGLALPLLATQILWINLVTDGAPALALGVDPTDTGIMRKPPRPRGEGVLTPPMWRGIFFVGAIMAIGTLAVLDASLPGGLIHGSGSLSYAQTMAFTTLMLFQIFNVLNARSDEESAFSGMFRNRWLWAAILLSLCLQGAVVHLPFLQSAFSTVSLSAGDWLICLLVASSVLWLHEINKVIIRLWRDKSPPPDPATALFSARSR